MRWKYIALPYRVLLDSMIAKQSKSRKKNFIIKIRGLTISEKLPQIKEIFDAVKTQNRGIIIIINILGGVKNHLDLSALICVRSLKT